MATDSDGAVTAREFGLLMRRTVPTGESDLREEFITPGSGEKRRIGWWDVTFTASVTAPFL